jgi:ectoine hydroxylase-related dioxygenase (phytanoyl-CoA dioxygenase family)
LSAHRDKMQVGVFRWFGTARVRSDPPEGELEMTRSIAAGRLRAADCRLEDLADVLVERTDPTDYPYASEVVDEVLVYDSARLRRGEPDAVAAELVHALSAGPGVVVFREAYPDRAVLDRATAAFEQLIAEQQAGGTVVGDHFAPPGANDRVWNALEKLAVRAPEVFVDYYANDIVALVATAWLGPGYQVTSQLNRVNPGGQAQVGHRDYHLGFLPNAAIERYPAHVHRLSPVLTLQGAVAHSDMPLESGPTLYLPHSQKYEPGYLAANRPDFAAYFVEHHVQLPLQAGDAAFFNPAVIHGAGTNRSSDIRRLANLLQISSAFGRAMESVDRDRMCRALYPALRAAAAAGADVGHAVAAAAEGYAFPTNLDRDPPVDGLAPPTQADLVRQALAQGWEPARFSTELAAHSARRDTT